MAEEMSDESELLRDLARRAIVDDAPRVAKFTDADRARKGRKRGDEARERREEERACNCSMISCSSQPPISSTTSSART
jgi:hypothetical protein